MLISFNQGVYRVKIKGRANFECAPPLRNLAESITPSQHIQKICVDALECPGMDSTFMGVLAMLGLKAKRLNAPMEIHRASESNQGLLKGLGLGKLFVFVNDRHVEEPDEWRPIDDKPADLLDNAETVHDAHETLMEVDKENVKRFEKVLEFAKKDLDRIKGEDDK